MLKIATQLFSDISDYLKNNPDVVKSMLIGGGIGAAGGLMALPGVSDENATAGERIKTKIKNALLGAAAGAASGTLINSAVKNFGEAKLKTQPTPEESVKGTADTITGYLDSPAGMGAVATVGAGAGAGKMYKSNEAAKLKDRNYVLSNLARENDKNKAVRNIFSSRGTEDSNRLAKETLNRYLRSDALTSSEKVQQLYKVINGRSDLDLNDKEAVKGFVKQLNKLGIDVNKIMPGHTYLKIPDGIKAPEAPILTDLLRANNKGLTKFLSRAAGKAGRNWRLGAGMLAGAGLAAGLGSYAPRQLYEWYYDE